MNLVIAKTSQEKPVAATHWSTRSMAAAVGVSEATVRRIWHAHGLKPHLAETLKVSNDPQFAEKLEAIVGLYLNPPVARDGLLRGREEPNPSARPNAAQPADEEGPLRHDDPRL